MNSKEAQARIKIDKLLEAAGWRLLDDENGRANVQLESGVTITQDDIDDLGDDFEKTTHGFIDYLLLDETKFPIAVLEAKREDKNPLDGKEQARKYAQAVNVRFIILSNGNLHYFWDIKTGNPHIITSIPTQDSITDHTSFKPNSDTLVREFIENDYVVLTQKPDYATEISIWMILKASVTA